MSIQVIILYLIIAGVIGLLVGLLLASLFGGGSKNVSKNLPPSDLLKRGFMDEARLWYSPTEKKLAVELDGDYFRDYSALSREQKKRIINLLTLLQTWVNTEKAPAPTLPEVIATPVDSMAVPESVIQPVQPFTSILPENDLNTDTRDLLGEVETDFGTDLIETEPFIKKNLSIAEQISAILEDMIKDTPLKEKGIKLIENQANGVDVWVGLEKFPGIDAVPYPEVQEMIRSAAKRWEHEIEIQNKLRT